jgi:hypothetical protein
VSYHGQITSSEDPAMAEYRPKIGMVVKNTLRRQAGGKCANPGCPNVRTHIHHIREWAVYQTHDEQDMIAVCPTCHDAIHHGRLEIPDETLYAWKSIKRVDRSNAGHLYVEPGGEQKLLLGSIAVSAEKRAMIFSLSPNSYVNLTFEDDEITLLDLSLTSVRGAEVVKIAKSGHYKAITHDEITVDSRPGAVRITGLCSPEFIPEWLIWAINDQDKEFIHHPVTLFSVEVLEPGLIRLEGIWAQGENAIVVTKDELSFYFKGSPKPKTLFGVGKDSVLQFSGTFALQGMPLFRFS